MKILKSVLSFRRWFLILFLGFAATVVAKEAPGDPILGRWRWHNNTALIFYSDGMAGWGETQKYGTWQCVSPNQDPRKYVLDWGKGMYLETLYLKKHAMKISGHDQLGHHVWGYRIEE
jgi:hypothetical protein